MPVTIKDVASASGVSLATVSYVLNNGPRKVNPHTRERVLRAVRELNYHPSAAARGLSRRRMDSIGVIFPHGHYAPVSNTYVGPLLDGILDVATRREQNVSLFTGHIWSDSQKSISSFGNGRCDGMIVINPTIGTQIVPALYSREVPLVLIGSGAVDPRVSSVDVDEAESARTVVAYLLDRGHRRIAYLGGTQSNYSTHLRHHGYRMALKEAGIECDPRLAPDGVYQIASGSDRTRALMALAQRDRPTALFCGSDEIALGALAAMKELGIRVPDHVSVVGYDNIPESAYTDPPLTTVNQPLRKIGERAAEILIGAITGTDKQTRQEVIATSLVERSSVGPAPKG